MARRFYDLPASAKQINSWDGPDGKAIPVYVDGDGRFWAAVPDARYGYGSVYHRAATLAGLEKLVRPKGTDADPLITAYSLEYPTHGARAHTISAQDPRTKRFRDKHGILHNSYGAFYLLTPPEIAAAEAMSREQTDLNERWSALKRNARKLTTDTYREAVAEAKASGAAQSIA